MIYNIMVTAAEIGAIKHKVKFLEKIEKNNLKKKLLNTVYEIRYSSFSWDTITEFSDILLQYSRDILDIDSIESKYKVSNICDWGFKISFPKDEDSDITLTVDCINRTITSDYYISRNEPILGNIRVYTTKDYCRACTMEFMSDAIKEICNILIGGNRDE